MLLPYRSRLIVAVKTLVGSTFEYSRIKTRRIEFKHVDKIFPGHVDSLLFEIIAERPVAEHLEHSVVVGVVSNLFEVVVLAAHTQTLLRISDTARLGHCITQDYVFELVHSGIGEHKGGIILYHHRGGGHDTMALGFEIVLEGLANFLCCKHISGFVIDFLRSVSVKKY